MTPTEYSQLFSRTLKDLGYRKNVAHACLGMVSEVGEMCDALKKPLVYGKELDLVNLIEEAGDTLWFCALLCREMEHDFADYFPKQELVPDDRERLVYDAAFYAAATASGAAFRVQHGLNHTFDHDLRKLLSTLSKIARVCGSTLEDAMDRNIAKLTKRYPEKFTEELALNRNLGAERAALEGHAGKGA